VNCTKPNCPICRATREANRRRRQQQLLMACAAGGKAIDYTTGRVRVVTLAELERRFDLQDNQVPVGQE
jgi:hypothetical protein